MDSSERNYSEKRDFIRMKINAALGAKLSAADKIIEGYCRDLSGNGMLVETREHIETGAILDVEVSSDHGHSPTLKAKTRVVRMTKNTNGNYELGLETLEVTA
jgi:hypothetical protein